MFALLRRFACVFVVPLFLVLAPVAGAVESEGTVLVHQAPPASEAPVDETARAWFVQLSGEPVADGGSAGAVSAEQDRFRGAARKNAVSVAERFAYSRLFNGISVAATAAEAAALARLDGVTGVYPVLAAAAPAGDTASPLLASALALTGADVAHSDLGLTGRGIRVAIVDSGVDVDHPDLGGCFGAGCRIEGGYDLVGDAFNYSDSASGPLSPTPRPDANPDDCAGHGTHVAGIVGANGSVVGVAPEVTLRAYRVLGCNGNTSSDVILAALERIDADGGADVVNLSIGASLQSWPGYPTARAADRLAKKGMVVVAAVGNDGAAGAYAAAAPSVGDRVIAVGSFDNSTLTRHTFSASPDDRVVGYQIAVGAPAPPLAGVLPLARTSATLSTADACATLAPNSLAGKAALIRRGTCPFSQKALNAQAAGAAAVVFFNDRAGFFVPNVTGGPAAVEIPVAMVTQADGNVLHSRLASSAVSITWRPGTLVAPVPTGGLVSTLSSLGMSAELTLKPDLGAPGGGIWSTYPLEKGGHQSIAGTSMASPHVAGAAALVLQARPKLRPEAVRTLLMNSADPRPFFGAPNAGVLDNVHRQGAGLLDVDDAVLATARVEPSKLSLGESAAGAATRTLTISNDAADAVTFTLSHAPALSTSGSSFSPSFVTGYASASFGATSVTVPAGGSASVDVTIAANPTLAERSQYGGYVVVTPDDGGEPLRVPYAGFKGDYQSIVALTATPCALPALVKVGGSSACSPGTLGGFTRQPSGATYSLVGTDLPVVLAHFDHPARIGRIDVVDAVSGRNWHRAFDEEWIARSGAAGGFYALAWDGTTRNGGGKSFVVPDGRYLLVLRVLKALGNPDDPAHWETWTSPPVTLDRP